MSFKSISVCISTPANSLLPAKYAICLAKILQVKLYAIHVINEKVLTDLLKSRVFVEVEARIYQKELEEQGQMFMERIKKLAESKRVDFEPLILRGDVSTEIVHKVKDIGSDMLVMGGLKEVFSVSEVFYDEGEKIFRKAPCPVVVARNNEYIDNMFKSL